MNLLDVTIKQELYFYIFFFLTILFLLRHRGTNRNDCLHVVTVQCLSLLLWLTITLLQPHCYLLILLHFLQSSIFILIILSLFLSTSIHSSSAPSSNSFFIFNVIFLALVKAFFQNSPHQSLCVSIETLFCK